MRKFFFAGLLAVVAGAFTQATEAQATLSVPNALAAGDEITITYSDASRAGQSITVEVDDGELPTPHIVLIVIQLDAKGKGSAQWTVPNWDSAAFNGPGLEQVTRAIRGPSPAPVDQLVLSRSTSLSM